MAGSFVQVQVRGKTQISQALNKLIKNTSNVEPALAEIGEYLLESTQQRFVDMQAPDGSPWEPLSETTLSRKNRTDRILTESGTLADTLNYQISNNELSLGSNMEYAAMHQFGGTTSPFSAFPNQEIPARPFLGIAPFERLEILDILNDHIEN